MLIAYSYKMMILPQKYLKLNDHIGQGLNVRIKLIIPENLSLNILHLFIFLIFEYMRIYILSCLIKQHQIQNQICHWFYTQGGRYSSLIFEPTSLM